MRSFPTGANLTPKEQSVLAVLEKIARLLDISPRTVEFHRANLLKKYGAKNTSDLVRKVFGY